jgi:hypothetical protein
VRSTGRPRRTFLREAKLKVGWPNLTAALRIIIESFSKELVNFQQVFEGKFSESFL